MIEVPVAPEGAALTLDNKRILSVSSFSGARCQCTHGGYRAGYFDGLTIIDRQRNMYRVRSARLIECPMWKKVAFLFFGGWREVALDIDFQGRIEQGRIVQMVTDSLRQDEEFWSAGGDVDELIADIAATRDVEAIISRLEYPGSGLNRLPGRQD